MERKHACHKLSEHVARDFVYLLSFSAIYKRRKANQSKTNNRILKLSNQCQIVNENSEQECTPN